MKLILIIAATILIPMNSWMCNLVYPDDIERWWMLRLDIYSLIFLLLFVSHSQKSVGKLEKYFNFTTYVGVGLTSSDVIDRWVFDITCFTWTDLIMVTVVLIIGYRKYLCQLTKCRH